jgi:hypothetical protein
MYSFPYIEVLKPLCDRLIHLCYIRGYIYAGTQLASHCDTLHVCPHSFRTEGVVQYRSTVLYNTSTVHVVVVFC